MKNGKYRILVDYTPWNGMDCKLIWDTFYVTGPDNYLQIQKQYKNPVCNADKTGWIFPQAVNVKPWDTIKWGLDSLHFPFVLGDSIKSLPAGKYKIYFSNQSGCLKYAEQTLVEPAAWVEKVVVKDKICASSVFDLSLKKVKAIAVETELPDAYSTKNWNLHISKPGFYKVKWTDSAGCNATDSFQINLDTWNAKLALHHKQICSGGEFEWTAFAFNSVFTTITNPDGITINADKIFINKFGKYLVNWKDSVGCTASDSLRVDSAIWTNKLTIDSAVCEKQVFTVNAYHPKAAITKYSTPSNQTFTGNTFTVSDAGNYVLFWKDSIGCSATDTVKIKRKTWSINLHIDTTLCIGQKIFKDLRNPRANKIEITDPFYSVVNQDTVTFTNAGLYTIKWTDINNCEAVDSIKIKKKNLQVTHDFLIPSEAFLKDSVFAVDHSTPKADKLTWSYDKPVQNSLIIQKYTNQLRFKDTGFYFIKLHGMYGSCGFEAEKKIHIFGEKDTAKTNSNLGYKGPLIQSYTISPNPHDGINYKAKVKLREVASITIYKIDPVSGEIIGDLEMKGSDTYEITQFTSYSDEVYFLKLICKNETKVLKVVVVK